MPDGLDAPEKEVLREDGTSQIPRELANRILVEMSQYQVDSAGRARPRASVFLNTLLADAMREAARLPLDAIATESYFQGEGFAQQARNLYAKNSSLESIVDQFRAYSIESGVRVPKKNIESVIRVLEKHATSLQPAVCEEIARLISSRDSRDVKYFVPFVKMMCFWDHLLWPFFGTVEYAARFGEDSAKLVAKTALDHIDLLSQKITYSGSMEYCIDPVWTSVIDNIFRPIEAENSDLMPVVLASVFPHIDGFINKNSLNLRDPDAEYDKEAKTYVALVTGANKVSERLARIIARRAVDEIGTLSRGQNASRYLDILEKVEKRDPQLVETVAEDCLKPSRIRASSPPDEDLPLLHNKDVFGSYMDTIGRFHAMDKETRENLISLLSYAASSSRRASTYLARVERIVSAVNNVGVLAKWLESAHKVLKSSESDFDLFLQYRFKEVHGLSPLQDELRLFPIALRAKATFYGKSISADYSSPADYTQRKDETSDDRRNLRKLVKMMYHLSAQYDRKTLKDEGLESLSAEVEKALHKIGKKRRVVFKGQGDVLCVKPKEDAQSIEQIIEEFPEIEEEIGAKELAVLTRHNFSELYRANEYPHLNEMAQKVRIAGGKRGRVLKKFVDTHGSGILRDIHRFINTYLADQLPRFSAYIRRMKDRLCTLDVDRVEVEEVSEPTNIIMNDMDNHDACVFESRVRDADKSIKNCAEASLSYIVDPYVHVMMMRTFGVGAEKNDIAAALLVETKLQSGDNVVLVDGVMANKDAKYITSREEGKGWKEMMLEAIIKRALRFHVNTMAFNISHGPNESSIAYEFTRFVAETVFGYRYGKDIRFHPKFGYVLMTEDEKNLPFGTDACIELRKEFKIHPDFEKRGLEDVWDGSGFYHSWYLENWWPTPTSKDPFWNKGGGRVRALVLKDVRQYAKSKGTI